MTPANEQPKEKKITVSFFLNKNVQPTGSTVNAKGKQVDTYPLYLGITYNRKNMQFKSKYGKSYSDVGELETGLKELEERVITKIIRSEISTLRENEEYNMKGISERYDILATSLSTCMEMYLKPKLRLAILSTNDPLLRALDLSKGAGKNKVLYLYSVAGSALKTFNTKIDKGLKADIEAYEKFSHLLESYTFDFPTIIDWLDGSYAEELKTLLSKEKKVSNEFLDKVCEMIDAAVKYAMKEIVRQMQK